LLSSSATEFPSDAPVQFSWDPEQRRSGTESRPPSATEWRVPRAHPRLRDGSLLTATTWIAVELDALAPTTPQRAALHLVDPARNLLTSRIALVRLILYTEVNFKHTPPVELEFALHHLAERTVAVVTESARDATFRY